jgi:hypothetical protein
MNFSKGIVIIKCIKLVHDIKLYHDAWSTQHKKKKKRFTILGHVQKILKTTTQNFVNSS